MSTLSLGFLISLAAQAQDESKKVSEVRSAAEETAAAEATTPVPSHCVPAVQQDPMEERDNDSRLSTSAQSVGDESDAAPVRAASGLMVFVDPESGQLTSQPSAGQAQRLLRTFETQARPATGDVQRPPTVIPGVGVGVFVGDLFVHNLNAIPDVGCPEGTRPVNSPSRPSARYPVAVQ